MSDAYVIEVNGRAAGVVVRDKRSYRFYAADPRYARLEGCRYGHPQEAERAALSADAAAGSENDRPTAGQLRI